jgi:nucleotide-binding universal stress UspA family protein
VKNILLLVHDDKGQEARFQAALDLARAVGGHLTCLDVAVMPVVTSGYFAGAAEAMLLADEREREASNRVRLEARLASEDVPWSWIDTVGEIAGALEQAAKTSDVVVLNRQLDSFPAPDMRYAASHVVLKSGKAVVAVPEGVNGIDLGGVAMIAFDGSEEAMTAVQAATPLLRLARTVSLVQIGEPGGIPAEDAAAYLSRHDVKAEIVRRAGARPNIAEALMSEAAGARADYIVMGGYGHSALVEALFGGVSRSFLTESPIPVLMAH